MEYDQQTLKGLTQSDEVIVYFTTGDRDHPEIEWRVYGGCQDSCRVFYAA